MGGSTARGWAMLSMAVASLAVTALLGAFSDLALAQSAQTDSSAAARAGAIAHAQKMRRLFPDTGRDTQETPLVIPQLEIDRDRRASGIWQLTFSN